MPITTDSTSSLTQSCFIIRPPRSLKKRTFADIVPSIFPTGLAGREDTETTLLRNKLYNDLWSSQKRKIENIFESIHSEGTEQVVNYISGEHVTEKLECGILLLGPNIAGHAKLFDRLSDLLSATKSTLCVSVSFRNFPNLKAGLKYIIKSVLGTTDFDDSDDELSTKKASGPGYSLSTLIPLFQNSYSRFTIAIQDAEAFDPSLLEQLIRHLYIFRDRLPLTLLLGISTPLSLFDSGFPGILHSLISTRLFDLEHTNKIMTSIILNVVLDPENLFRLGPDVFAFMRKRYELWNGSVENLISELQFAAMSHFWGNPLCILLSSPIDTSIITPDHCQAIRNLVSFKEFVERKLAETDIGEAKALLNDDDYLRELVVQFADMLKQYHQHLKFALEILLVLQSCLVSVKQINILKIYENILTENAEKHINSILLSLKKISSSNLQNFLEQAINLLPKQHHWSTHLEELLDSLPSEKVLSEHQIRQESKSETTRATNNSQKASFSTNKDTMSKHDITYTKLVNSVHAYLKEFIFVHLHAPFDLPLYEAFYYNNLKPLQAVFQPKYRQNIQNALVHPEFYLGELDLKKQPSSAVLFQRYLETGALINIFDWWTSFQTVFKDEEGQVGEEQELIQAKFMNSMEELRYLGFIKSTKRKTDHVCRMVWGNV